LHGFFVDDIQLCGYIEEKRGVMPEEENKGPENKTPNGAVAVDPMGFNTIALIGDISEDTSNEVVYSLLLLKQKNAEEYLTTVLSMDEEQLNENDLEQIKPNIDFYISTNGGSADEMFAMYDVMRMIKDEGINSISTYGIGKVMSAGVLLLASGTKGKRYVGKHCRVMIHSVIGGHVGPMHQLESEFEEVKKIQDTYIKSLAEETEMTEKYLRNLLKKKTNVYLTAQEAVDLGIADEII
jgi:ATP-dependent Clp protease, protease subunit